MKKKDIEYIYAIKLIGILAVVIGHLNTPMTNFIFSWHMPLFFFVAGYFFNLNLDFKSYLMKNMKKLLIPYFIISIVSILLGNIKNYIKGDTFYSIKNILLAIANGMSLDYISSYGFVLWFLLALFWGKIIIYLCVKYVKKDFFIFIILIVSSFFIAFYKVKFPFVVFQGIIGGLWIYCGYFYYNKLKKYLNYKFEIVLVIIFIVMLIYKIPNLDIANIYFEFFIYNFIFSTLFLIIMDVTLELIANKKNKIIRFIGKNTMLIFIVHPYTNNIAYIISKKYFKENWVLTTLISIVLIISFMKILKKVEIKGGKIIEI